MFTANLRSLPSVDPGPWTELPFDEAETSWDHLPLISKRQLETLKKKLKTLVCGKWDLVGYADGAVVAQQLQYAQARSGGLMAEVVRGRWLKVDPATGAWEVWRSGFFQRGHVEYPQMDRLVVVSRVRRFRFLDSGYEFYADQTEGTAIVAVSQYGPVEVYTQAVSLAAVCAAIEEARKGGEA